MIKWEVLSRPKEHGGLGFMDVRVTNSCLLVKWIDRIERGNTGLCCTILRNKYLGDKSIYQIKTRKGSQFWRSPLNVRDWYQQGRMIKVKSGRQTRFWHDCWLGNCALKISFPNLFQIASFPDLVVSKACVGDRWHIDFRRQLNEGLREDWGCLQELLSEVALSEGSDEVYWGLDSGTLS